MDEISSSRSLTAADAGNTELIRNASDSVPTLIASAGGAAKFAWEEFVYGRLPKSRHEASIFVRSATFPRMVHRPWRRTQSHRSSPCRPLHGRIDPCAGDEEAASRGAASLLSTSSYSATSSYSIRRQPCEVNGCKSSKARRPRSPSSSAGRSSPASTRVPWSGSETERLSLSLSTRPHASVPSPNSDAATSTTLATSTVSASPRKEPSSARSRSATTYVGSSLSTSKPRASSTRLPTSPLFRTTIRRTKTLTQNGMTTGDISRMVKRRLADAGLSRAFSPHSFRVCTVTDLLHQGVPLADVQMLAGHADPRTTRLYDRRHRQVTRNIVERISV